jgi:protease IV
MSDPLTPEQDVPTLQPVRPAEPPSPPPASPPPAPPPPPAQGGMPPYGGYFPPAPAAAPVRRTPGWVILLLVLFGLGLIASVSVNVFMFSDFATDLETVGTMKATTLQAGRTDQTVAFYRVAGIIDGRAAAEFQQFCNAVGDDRNVKAVVLRVESPGGGVTSSDQMCEAVKALKAKNKKVVVSMGVVAASGGYYISAPADEIYAEPTTVTGSIGVIAGWVVLKGTLDKIGAEPIVMKSTHAQGWKDEISMYARPHDYQVKHMQEVLDKMQERFEETVRAGRGIRLHPQQASYTIPATQGAEAARRTETEPLNGKIYLPERAKELGLIDQIGYQDAAIKRAEVLAGLNHPRVVQYFRHRGVMEMLIDGRSSGSFKLDASLLDRLQTPRFMMLWQAE